MPRIFPNSLVENRVICVIGVGARSVFSALMTNTLPNLHTLDTGQCFPLKLYEPKLSNEQTSGRKLQADLFSFEHLEQTIDVIEQTANYQRYTVKDGITDAGLANFQAAYPDQTINKEDVFYYIYGLLHSEEYNSKFADNLTKYVLKACHSISPLASNGVKRATIGPRRLTIKNE